MEVEPVMVQRLNATALLEISPLGIGCGSA